MSEVYIKFPKAGLGNMLLVWAKGVVFARLNNLPYTTSSWWGFRWGALWRREKKKRLYFGYFNETPFWKQVLVKFYCLILNVENEPVVNVVKTTSNTIYLFEEALSEADIFGAIRNHYAIVVSELDKILRFKIKLKLASYDAPIIGVHIRRGDFNLANQGTPLNFFIKGIELVRSSLGPNLPVTIFTDANAGELKELMVIPNMRIAEKKPDILDILLLSKSKILLLSKSSTFSYWAAFLSDATVIRPMDDWQDKIKEFNGSSGYEEIKWNYENENSTVQLTKKLMEKQINIPVSLLKI